MSNSGEKTQVCNTCGMRKPVSMFPKWRLKCRACKSAENSARLKERYATDPKFAERTKQRAAVWQQANTERANEYQRRRHARKVAEGDRAYLSKMSTAQRRYRESEKGKAAIAARQQRYEVSGQNAAQRKARYARPESRASQLVAGARSRALKYGLECSITFDDVYPAVLAGACPKTGVPFELAPHSSLRRHSQAPSIDRVDSAKGYVRGNVQIVCNWYNLAKHELSEAQMLAFCQAVVDKSS